MACTFTRCITKMLVSMFYRISDMSFMSSMSSMSTMSSSFSLLEARCDYLGSCRIERYAAI